ncbi:AbgT family transporter [Clostridium tetani]|uniref:AbgT family transporter n=1 Tax=Clostridium tetani TaxID=1513 RepID=A0A4Q0UWJ5_CLOTA|nr:AbgT family transporter [Clostridium tetani]RXI37725.1 AbgT family transporter [Clostridium tetani]RXI47532.1 AbgT family transporter [Clostridium tetani]
MGETQKNPRKRTRKGGFQSFLDWVERVGNKMPHPAMIFIVLSIAVIIISHICAKAGINVDVNMVDRVKGGTKVTNVKAVSLLTADGIRYMFESAEKNFTGFAPLGTVLVAMLGVGLAEETGLIQAILRKTVMSAPPKLITVIVVLAGIMSNIASDAGYVVLIPLGAMIFASFGRHPLAGIAAAFAGVSGGFSANLIIGTTDPLLGGITTEAAKLIDPSYVVEPTANYWFMVASTFLITIIGTFVTDRIVEPRLGKYQGGEVDLGTGKLSDEEKKALKASRIAFLIFLLVMAALLVPQNGILRHPETHKILGKTPFMNALVPIIAIFFAVPGIAYGVSIGKIKSSKDVANAMGKAMSGMGGYLVLVFFAAQFVAYFGHTNLGTILAFKGAEFLEATKFVGIPLILSFIIVAAFINLFMGSASAKWAIMAPIFVPMFMAIGYSPEFTQAAYRVGDSCTNIITPLMSYFALIVSFAEQYDEDTGIGTLISTMLPYAILFLIGWSLLLILWYKLGIPIGVNAPIHL